MRPSLIIIIILAVVIAGCIEEPRTDEEKAVTACISLCEDALEQGQNLTIGPCLSNQVGVGWVCDVAHKNRTAEDNDPANQCEAILRGEAKHFVEVNPACSLIRSM